MPRVTCLPGVTMLVMLLCAVPLVALRPPQATPAGAAATASVAMKDIPADGAHWKGQDLFGKGVLYAQASEPKYTVYAQRRDRDGAIEVHEQDTDIIFIMDGAATFVTGGSLVGERTLRPHELTGSGVSQGVERRVSRGDVFIVPKGTIHWFKTVAGSVSYYAVKIHEPDAAPVNPPAAMQWTRAEAFAQKGPFYDGGQAHRYQVFAVQRDGPVAPEIHEKDADIVFFLDGTATWTIGGTQQPGAKTTSGGTPRRVGPDDAVIVAPKVWHWFDMVPGKLAYYAMKVY